MTTAKVETTATMSRRFARHDCTELSARYFIFLYVCMYVVCITGAFSNQLKNLTIFSWPPKPKCMYVCMYG